MGRTNKTQSPDSPFAQIFELDLIIMAKKAYSIKFSEDLAVVNFEKINTR